MPDQMMPGARQIASHDRPEALVDVLDSLLDTGVVADAQLIISVAGVDLIYVGLRALLASMDTAGRMMLAPPASKPAADTSTARNAP